MVVPELHPDLKNALTQVRKHRNFNAEQWIDQKTNLFNDYMRKNRLKSCVVNMSGGVDSAATFALMVHASQKSDSPIEKIVGIAQPIHSTEAIWKRALECVQIPDDENIFSFSDKKNSENSDNIFSLNGKKIEIITVDQSSIFDQLSQLVEGSLKLAGNDFSRGQMKSYMRTPVAFYVAQLLTQHGLPCIVLGTGNRDEDGYLYYFCKAGDGVSDVQLLNDLHKSEVFLVSEKLNVPRSILEAPPSADLWDGQTDEDELGFSYDFVELLTEYLDMDEERKQNMLQLLSVDALKQFRELEAKAVAVHNRNSHKADYPFNINIL